ncbi:flavin-containing monooxygenase [Streptomyces qinzhouensis]|uniref:NAD(P)/FAD-dependent oxidoreductase n=1 Tax=Streptomyces qinzhouensis TaxID=2599401 RepID=A0A5B8JBT1_9ACTN|nr:NAD(P)/FAD-dependent oxidoreductase [Streptomyces qinzhouensis]QDY77351.1 NAD(P)/FAD-dependent oxidoreductase [Streptomyces qinzhouensis]
MDIDRTAEMPVYVIGGGPAGLATAAALRERGVRAVVLEKSPSVGASWRGHYDRLRLHTSRRKSALPGLPMPRSFGRWVSRDDVVRYLEKYAEFHELDVVTGVEVTRIEPAPVPDPDPTPDPESANGTGTGTGTSAKGRRRRTAPPAWLLHATGGRRLTGRAVVVATGYSHTPRLPDWPGRPSFTRPLLHAREYRNPVPYEGMDVLVVGAGNTGAEIAVDLAEGGAARVRLAVRTPPHIVRRSTLGWTAQHSAVAVRRLPVFLVDRLARAQTAIAVPDLSAYGLPRPEKGLYTRVREGALPVQDVGLIRAVRRGAVEPVAAVESFDRDTVVLADGEKLSPDAVIAATGYERGLGGMLGHLGVLDDRGRPRTRGHRCPGGAPGLYFTGFTNPLTGMLREISLDAGRIAKAIDRH